MEHWKRRRRAKGRWMRLKDPDLLRRYINEREFTQARLARYAGCSRQFIWQLLNDPTRRTCTDEVARRIEEAFGLVSGTLFAPSKSPDERHEVKSTRTPAA